VAAGQAAAEVLVEAEQLELGGQVDGPDRHVGGHLEADRREVEQAPDAGGDDLVGGGLGRVGRGREHRELDTTLGDDGRQVRGRLDDVVAEPASRRRWGRRRRARPSRTPVG
jgi:hypothetical protein